MVLLEALCHGSRCIAASSVKGLGSEEPTVVDGTFDRF